MISEVRSGELLTICASSAYKNTGMDSDMDSDSLTMSRRLIRICDFCEKLDILLKHVPIILPITLLLSADYRLFRN